MAEPSSSERLRARGAAAHAELTRPRFHTICGQTHTPGPCPADAAQTPASVPVCLPSLQEPCGSCHRCQTPASSAVTEPDQKGSSEQVGEGR